MTHQNRIASLRRLWALAQDDLAYLLDLTRQTVSKMELGETVPTIATALALECLFDLPVSQIFPGLCLAAFAALESRTAEFSVRIEGDTSAKADRQRALLASFAQRAPDDVDA